MKNKKKLLKVYEAGHTKSLTLLTFKHQTDDSEIGRKGKLAILRDPCLKKVELESFS